MASRWRSAGHNAPGPLATIVRSGLIRTHAHTRPAPSVAFYPGLTSRPFWDVHTQVGAPAPAHPGTHGHAHGHGESVFPWISSLQAALPVLQREYAVVRGSAGSDYQVKADEHTLHSGNWSWHSCVTKGKIQPQFTLLCPETAAMLQRIPDFLTGIPFAYAFFSTLTAGATIAPHFGPCNVRLRVHMPLHVPSSDPKLCGIRVGDETRAWKVGEPMIFDDSFEHETWNHTGEDRVVLLFDLWHPELTHPERDALLGMFDHARQQGWLS